MAADPHTDRPPQTPPKPRVLVIGGGLGGMAAAFNLARILGPGNVLLVEARPETGGRVRSFTDSESGELIDNCQHLLMGCCANLRQFTTDAGLEDAWIRQDFLTFATPDGKISRFQADPLPAPFHLTRAFLGLHTLPFQRKIALGRTMLAMAAWKDSGTDQAVEAWLLEKGQTPSDNVAFWEPLLVSALNDSLSRLGMRAARQVVAEAFLGGKNAFDLWLPARPLGELFGENLKAKILLAGVKVLVDHPIRGALLLGPSWPNPNSGNQLAMNPAELKGRGIRTQRQKRARKSIQGDGFLKRLESPLGQLGANPASIIRDFDLKTGE